MVPGPMERGSGRHRSLQLRSSIRKWIQGDIGPSAQGLPFMVWLPSSCQFSRWGLWEWLPKLLWKAMLADPPDTWDFTTDPGMLARLASLLSLLCLPRKGCQPPACLLCLGDFRCVSEKCWLLRSSSRPLVLPQFSPATEGMVISCAHLKDGEPTHLCGGVEESVEESDAGTLCLFAFPKSLSKLTQPRLPHPLSLGQPPPFYSEARGMGNFVISENLAFLISS